ncbi:hypothetical protein PoB_006784900 [Plakobranchus ocellatus]|uniref:Uncharacterized protein n=1 Tax=Plakobranchus ocellatus TaxID=259542 RepID=A0AAV4DAY4_9GAST|nr:hypothetical protein PoB_006784900 [Plakobranchus ocellatus]
MTYALYDRVNFDGAENNARVREQYCRSNKNDTSNRHGTDIDDDDVHDIFDSMSRPQWAFAQSNLRRYCHHGPWKRVLHLHSCSFCLPCVPAGRATVLALLCQAIVEIQDSSQNVPFQNERLSVGDRIPRSAQRRSIADRPPSPPFSSDPSSAVSTAAPTLPRSGQRTSVQSRPGSLRYD